jgi:hypothetical protein
MKPESGVRWWLSLSRDRVLDRGGNGRHTDTPYSTRTDANSANNIPFATEYLSFCERVLRSFPKLFHLHPTTNHYSHHVSLYRSRARGGQDRAWQRVPAEGAGQGPHGKSSLLVLPIPSLRFLGRWPIHGVPLPTSHPTHRTLSTPPRETCVASGGHPGHIPEDRAPGFDRGYLWPHALMRSHTACVSRTHKRWLLERSRWPPASDKKFFGRSEPARVHSYRVHPPTVLLPHVGAVSIIGPGPGR